jgi:hypothetical protein
MVFQFGITDELQEAGQAKMDRSQPHCRIITRIEMKEKLNRVR